MTATEEKQILATLAAQAQYIAELEAKLVIAGDLRKSINSALARASLSRTKTVLTIQEFDFEGSQSARTQMLQKLESANQSGEILSCVLAFAKVFAPLALV